MPLPENVENLQRLSAKNVIYQALCEWIISGTLQPGEKLVDTEVAKRFNVSRTPVREAFQLLESQKLIQVVPGCSTVVAGIDRTDIEKCYRVLAELQALGAFLSCSRLTEAELAELERIHAAFASACLENRASEAVAWDNRFHENILHAAGNEYLEDFSRVMILHIQRIKYHYFQFDQLRCTSARHHREILDALESRDAELAQQRLRNHWLYVMKRSIEDVMAEDVPPKK